MNFDTPRVPPALSELLLTPRKGYQGPERAEVGLGAHRTAVPDRASPLPTAPSPQPARGDLDFDGHY